MRLDIFMEEIGEYLRIGNDIFIVIVLAIFLMGFVVVGIEIFKAFRDFVNSYKNTHIKK